MSFFSDSITLSKGKQTVLDVTYLSGRPTAGEEVSVVITMKWDIENTGVVVKHFLRAITMVNVLAMVMRRDYFSTIVATVMF